TRPCLDTNPTQKRHPTHTVPPRGQKHAAPKRAGKRKKKGPNPPPKIPPRRNRRRSQRATPAKLVADRLQDHRHGDVAYAGGKKSREHRNRDNDPAVKERRCHRLAVYRAESGLANGCPTCR